MMRRVRILASEQAGNVAIIFGLALPVGLALVAAAVNFANGNWQRSEAQTALDGAALASVMLFGDASKTPADIESLARSFLASKAPKVPDINTKSTVSVETAARAVEIGYDSKVDSPISFIIWDGDVPVAARARAMLQPKRFPVCILITEPTREHTLLAKNNSKVDLTDCLVQVNTKSWDAVETHDTSYLHTVNGQHCFVGGFHYGDIQPGKEPTCTFYTDPFALMTIPNPGSCTYTNKVVTTPATLSPGTYCEGLEIKANTIFQKGVYIIKNLRFKVTGLSTNVTANGATFILTGNDSGVEIDTAGTLNFTAASSADAGQFGGFVFYLNQQTIGQADDESKIEKATINLSGIIYLAGQKLELTNDLKLTVNPGGIVAGYLLPDKTTLKLTGTLNSSTAAEQALQKTSGSGGTALLVK